MLEIGVTTMADVTKIPAGRRGPRRPTQERGPKLTPVELVQHQQLRAQEVATQRDLDARELAERAKSIGMKRRRVRANDGTVKEVWTFAASYHAMGFQDHQIHAAEKFGDDWEAAYRTLRGQGFEAGVDGSRASHRAHFAQVDAQTRLQACRDYLGQRSFDVVVAIVVHGATIRGLAPLAHTHDRNIRQDVDNSFNDLAAFYTGNRLKDRTWDAIERFNAERAAMIERAEREVG